MPCKVSASINFLSKVNPLITTRKCDSNKYNILKGVINYYNDFKNNILDDKYLILDKYDIKLLQENSKFITPPPGRLEKIMSNIYVDYAHTPNGISTMIKCFREITDKKIVVVFGAGGNRDATKRKIMGKESSKADIIIITSDNPRFEDPLEICNQIYE